MTCLRNLYRYKVHLAKGYLHVALSKLRVTRQSCSVLYVFFLPFFLEQLILFNCLYYVILMRANERAVVLAICLNSIGKSKHILNVPFKYI